jgi:tetratricopeptide (TPR) repeat protein
LKFAQVAKEKLPDDPSVMDTLGWIYYKKGLYGNAVQEFSDSLEKLPENATVHYHLGAALLKKGDKARAKLSLEKALALDDNFDGAKDARGCCRRYSRCFSAGALMPCTNFYTIRDNDAPLPI